MDESLQTPPLKASVSGRSPWRSWLAGLAALVLLALALYALVAQRNLAPAPKAVTPSVVPQVDPQAEQIATLRTRLDDAQKVNEFLRAQSLALTERLGLVEDALAGLSRGAAPAAEAFKLDEAEYLLGLAQVRLELFADPDSAQRAVELADDMLRGLNDPRIAAVRQTLAIELDVLKAAPRTDLASLSGRLRALSEALPNVPIRIVDDTAPSARSRIAALFDRYLVIRREGEAMPMIGRSAWAVREALKIEFERAQLALERQQGEAWRGALQTAVALAEASLLLDQPAAQSYLQRLRELGQVALAPPPPPLGAGLRELRRLRAASTPGMEVPEDTSEPIPSTQTQSPLGEAPVDPLPPAELPPDMPVPQPDVQTPEATTPAEAPTQL